MAKASEVINLARQELGYHEKASVANLDDKTANSGSNNITKYWRDLANAGYYQSSKQGAEWCDGFVDWLFYTLYGKEKGEWLECQTGVLGAGTPYSAGYYKAQGRYDSTPKPGDQIFFQRYGNICHTGIVEDVKDGIVYTIEGNSSNQVERRSYKIGDSYIAGYGHPKYDVEEPKSQAVGVDVSVHNGPNINWKQVKAGGVDFAIIRIGYGDHLRTGVFHIESCAPINIKGASEAGLDIGFYWFSYAATAEEAKREADFFCDYIDQCGVKPNYPVCFDYEYHSEEKSPPVDSIVSIARAFLRRVKERGYHPANYTNIDYLSRGFDQLVGEFDTWLAQWGATKPSRDCTIWQYTSTGYPVGFDKAYLGGRSDMNICFVDYPAIISGDTPKPDPEPTPTPTPTPSGGTCMVDCKILRKGDSNDTVKSWQALLNVWGYNCGTPDRIFGAKTEEQTKKFQKDYGLEADGIVGKLTWDMMLA